MTTLVDPVVSPSSSPSLSPTRSRRLSSRRGSVSASDPWGVHSPLNNNPLRSTSSRLTIVRVPPPTEGEQYPRRHGRHGSNASLSSNSSAGKPEGSRMSFAFSSFGTSPGSGGPHGSSPTWSPRIRPQSPTLSRRYSGSINKLPPEQLLDVARQACNPRPTNGSNGGSPTLPAEKPGSVSFTPLPDAILLPFVERPFEVGQLMSTPPSAKLFSLLAQMFPESTRAFTGKESADALLSSDPKTWTYAELAFWLKSVDRDVADDAPWVHKARTCIMAKSELIWERIKGALGVPAELDGDDDALPPVLDPTPTASSVPVLSSSADSADKFPIVFEAPSPVLSATPPSPTLGADELTIEPVLANSARPPTSSALDPHELCEVREEDEDEEDAGNDADTKADNEDEQEVHGLRIATSPATPFSSNYALSPGGEPSPLPLGSPAASPMSIPRSNSIHDRDMPYDALHERGPGHPLFPSSFAHLSMTPTLRKSSYTTGRAQSMWNPPLPAFGNPHSIRMGGHAASATGSGFRRPDWAQGYDPARHEFAVASSTGSVSGIE
ncbi:hypothetical protein IEO21_01101 [Rhodonia placenta]|uniref:Uncharacterized protein n=1 Tax=Rhodonia placenta TaxID=104341 RepID=A0A8H7PAA0_9APHY|nr:hypothetical protein IEO21_01101 [Postia placenta]